MTFKFWKKGQNCFEAFPICLGILPVLGGNARNVTKFVTVIFFVTFDEFVSVPSNKVTFWPHSTFFSFFNSNNNENV